ncbi:hypothetical protein FA13DRAFT_1708406 [Coprinellus micaceus]|uniref:Uncharacterized protein n=1 Tax=Coprinellus micaceus TaxID=71717 RepID=A0A4Y7TFL7_COPMI|nr:hypothetical protein FA13DRAFT_1708406 [Coprinellus micaceus]
MPAWAAVRAKEPGVRIHRRRDEVTRVPLQNAADPLLPIFLDQELVVSQRFARTHLKSSRTNGLFLAYNEWETPQTSFKPSDRGMLPFDTPAGSVEALEKVNEQKRARGKQQTSDDNDAGSQRAKGKRQQGGVDGIVRDASVDEALYTAIRG